MISLLSNKFKVTRFAEQLVSLSKYYKFDGWLVNIENPIHVSEVYIVDAKSLKGGDVKKFYVNFGLISVHKNFCSIRFCRN